MSDEITVELDFILQLEIVLTEGNRVTQAGFDISYDGDHKSGEICVSNGNKEIWISSNDVEDYQEE